MNKAQAIEETIKHWERMIKWAKKQKQTVVLHKEMLMGIGEYWYDKHCPLCKKYYQDGDCGKCPLYLKYGRCGSQPYHLNYKGNRWWYVAISKTWEGWVRNAEAFLEQIKSLR